MCSWEAEVICFCLPETPLKPISNTHVISLAQGRTMSQCLKFQLFPRHVQSRFMGNGKNLFCGGEGHASSSSVRWGLNWSRSYFKPSSHLCQTVNEASSRKITIGLYDLQWLVLSKSGCVGQEVAILNPSLPSSCPVGREESNEQGIEIFSKILHYVAVFHSQKSHLSLTYLLPSLFGCLIRDFETRLTVWVCTSLECKKTAAKLKQFCTIFPIDTSLMSLVLAGDPDKQALFNMYRIHNSKKNVEFKWCRTMAIKSQFTENFEDVICVQFEMSRQEELRSVRKPQTWPRSLGVLVPFNMASRQYFDTSTCREEGKVKEFSFQSAFAERH